MTLLISLPALYLKCFLLSSISALIRLHFIFLKNSTLCLHVSIIYNHASRNKKPTENHKAVWTNSQCPSQVKECDAEEYIIDRNITVQP